MAEDAVSVTETVHERDTTFAQRDASYQPHGNSEIQKRMVTAWLSSFDH